MSFITPPARKGTFLACALLLALCSPAIRAQGLRGEYFNNLNLAGVPIIRVDLEINFAWEQRSLSPTLDTLIREKQ